MKWNVSIAKELKKWIVRKLIRKQSLSSALNQGKEDNSENFPVVRIKVYIKNDLA